jgi:hypothetical protein
VERELAWNVARDLFGRALVQLPAPERRSIVRGAAQLAVGPLGLVVDDVGRDRPGPDTAAVLYGLYWLCSNLAQRAPVLICVDDFHWADPPSAHWLAYLIERVSDLPVLVAVGVRTGEVSREEVAALGGKAPRST